MQRKTVSTEKIRTEYLGMPHFLLAIVLLFACTVPAAGELTSADLLHMQQRMEATVEKSEARLKTYIDTKIESVETHIGSLEKSVEARLTLLTALVFALIALIVLGIGIPQLLISRKSSLAAEQATINEELRAEIEALKKQLSIHPGG